MEAETSEKKKTVKRVTKVKLNKPLRGHGLLTVFALTAFLSIIVFYRAQSVAVQAQQQTRYKSDIVAHQIEDKNECAKGVDEAFAQDVRQHRKDRLDLVKKAYTERSKSIQEANDDLRLKLAAAKLDENVQVEYKRLHQSEIERVNKVYTSAIDNADNRFNAFLDEARLIHANATVACG